MAAAAPQPLSARGQYRQRPRAEFVLAAAEAAPRPLSARGQHRQRPRAHLALPAAAVAPRPLSARGQRPQRPLAKETARALVLKASNAQHNPKRFGIAPSPDTATGA